MTKVFCCKQLSLVENKQDHETRTMKMTIEIFLATVVLDLKVENSTIPTFVFGLTYSPLNSAACRKITLVTLLEKMFCLHENINEIS